MDWSLYDRNLCHEKVNVNFELIQHIIQETLLTLDRYLPQGECFLKTRIEVTKTGLADVILVSVSVNLNKFYTFS